MLRLRKTYNTVTKRYFFFENGKSISETTYKEKSDHAARNMRFNGMETFRHGHYFIEGTPLISTESVYVAW